MSAVGETLTREQQVAALELTLRLAVARAGDVAARAYGQGLADAYLEEFAPATDRGGWWRRRAILEAEAELDRFASQPERAA
jgi:hypothetical protein